MASVRHSPRKAHDELHYDDPNCNLCIQTAGRDGTGKRKPEDEPDAGEVKKAKGHTENNHNTTSDLQTIIRLINNQGDQINNMELNITKRLTDVENTLAGRLEELEARIDDLEGTNATLTRQIQNLEEENLILKKKVEITETKVDHLERKNNIIIFGLGEQHDETKHQLHEKVNNFIQREMEMTGIYIENAYRLKTGKVGKPRGVKVTFSKKSECDAVMNKRMLLKTKKIPVYLSPDLNKVEAEKARKNREKKKAQRMEQNQ
ncbi:unnamed protein product [Allacma fusca]|uniref:Uncharacterized protein n=1 Tax=Allacma fusca TaxID=39272 RepID=A0A8J2LGF4_9HEXA|nr:unnamed protein product [Allacma fusca]